MSFTTSDGNEGAFAISQMGTEPLSELRSEHDQIVSHGNEHEHPSRPTLGELREGASVLAQPPNTPAPPLHLYFPLMHAPHLHPLHPMHPMHITIPAHKRGEIEARELWTPGHGHMLIVVRGRRASRSDSGSSSTTTQPPLRIPVRTSRRRSLFSTTDDEPAEGRSAGNTLGTSTDDAPFADGRDACKMIPSTSDVSDEDMSDAEPNGLVDRAQSEQDNGDNNEHNE
ncbi:hypothetical protein C8Q79DRAFT_1011098 [Trametes meyenii]|nr:hypothetical protein C8Q79DRAFT_1011098 [Trametes meyenii]